MNKLYTVLFLLVSSFSQAQENWKTLNVPEVGRYDDIFFINDKVGWAVGSRGGTDPVYRIFKTKNGGSVWYQIGPFFNSYLRSIEFFDTDIGLCGTLNNLVSNGTLYRTTDGGATWTDVGANISPRPRGVCGLAKADENTIYGVGVYFDSENPNPAFVIKSTDKGLNWTYIDMSAYASTLIDVYFFDANHGFVTGSKNAEEGGIVLYTADGGQTWEEKFVTNGISERIWKIQTPDNIHFYGSVEKLVEEGGTKIIRSSDAGQTWEIVTVWPEYHLCQMVGFINSQHGWTGGYGQLFETLDGGSTWQKINVGLRHNRFLKINDSVAYLTGQKIYKFDRSESEDEGEGEGEGESITSIPDSESYDPIHKIKIFPNPTVGKATVNVTFASNTMAQVYLYSIVGKSLQKIYAGGVKAGEKTFSIDLSGQSPGTFIVTVETNEGMESIKLIKDQ